MHSKNNKYVIFSFFAGAGFLDLGFEHNDFNIVFVNELKDSFLEAYKFSRKNLNISTPKYGYSNHDINEYLNGKKFNVLKEIIENLRKEGKLIGFIGGPPCPDFSIAGKNKGIDGDNGKLTQTYFEIIAKLKPDFFLFENVKGLLKTKKHRLFYDQMRASIQEGGYRITDRLINSIYYGAPQERERIILIGFLNNSIKRKYNHDFGTIPNSVFDWSSYFKYSIFDINNSNWPIQDSFSIDSDLEMPNNIISELTVEHWFKINKVNKHPNSERYFIPRSGLRKFLIINEGDVTRKSYKRLHRWRYSPTVAYGNNEVHLHPYKPRRLSLSEALSLQSLPLDFSLPNYLTLTDSFKIVGNGVPYLAARSISKSIKEFLNYLYDEANSGQFGKFHQSVA